MPNIQIQPWEFGVRKLYHQYQTQHNFIGKVSQGVFTNFELEPVTGAQVDTVGPCKCLGLVSLHLTYAVSYSEIGTPDIFIMVFDAYENEDELFMPIFVQRVPFGDTFWYEAPNMEGAIFDKCFNHGVDDIGQPDIDAMIWNGYRFRKGIRVCASSSKTVFAPVADVFYISEAVTIHPRGGC
jgi:hypothetical protein